MPKNEIQLATDEERGQFIQLLKQVEEEFWCVTKERDVNLQRA